MYSIRTTLAIVLRAASRREADKVYEFLTEDFGLVVAEAKGVRKLQSKLRYGLSDLSLIELSLVKGKEHWRISGVKPVSDFFAGLRGRSEVLFLIRRIILLIIRLVPRDEPNKPVFDNLLNGLKLLSSKGFEAKMLQNLECVLALRILYSLGYIGNLPELNLFVESPLFDADLVLKMENLKTKAFVEINRSIKESHL